MKGTTSRWSKALRPFHRYHGINCGVRLIGRCVSCGVEIEEYETFVADGIAGERCRACWLRLLEG